MCKIKGKILANTSKTLFEEMMFSLKNFTESVVFCNKMAAAWRWITNKLICQKYIKAYLFGFACGIFLQRFIKALHISFFEPPVYMSSGVRHNTGCHSATVACRPIGPVSKDKFREAPHIASGKNCGSYTPISMNFYLASLEMSIIDFLKPVKKPGRLRYFLEVLIHDEQRSSTQQWRG